MKKVPLSTRDTITTKSGSFLLPDSLHCTVVLTPQIPVVSRNWELLLLGKQNHLPNSTGNHEPVSFMLLTSFVKSALEKAGIFFATRLLL